MEWKQIETENSFLKMLAIVIKRHPGYNYTVAYFDIIISTPLTIPVHGYYLIL